MTSCRHTKMKKDKQRLSEFSKVVRDAAGGAREREYVADALEWEDR